jgi:hypothetical protein
VPICFAGEETFFGPGAKENGSLVCRLHRWVVLF